jgi:copper resistance protein B
MRPLYGAVVFTLASIAAAHAQTQSALEHVPPDPPQSSVHAMPYGEMARMMGMDDRKLFGKVMLDRIEWQNTSGDARLEWDAAAWYGGDFSKLRIESEGEQRTGDTEDSRTEIAWDRIVSAWWSLRLGARHDGGAGPARDWAAVGIAGLAPGFIEVEASVYLGEDGRTALRFTGQRDFLFTQRLVLQPEIELAAYGKDDAGRLIGAGLSDLKIGLRLRYEVRREFAPYIGVGWEGHLGDSADLRQAAGEDAHEFLWLAGVRAWF